MSECRVVGGGPRPAALRSAQLPERFPARGGRRPEGYLTWPKRRPRRIKLATQKYPRESAEEVKLEARAE